jgi:hypothetical protein
MWEKTKVIRCQNQSGLPQRSIGICSVSAHREGAGNTSRAGISMRPKLARSCWFDTMMGKSLRRTGTERDREKRKEVCFWLVLSRGFPQQEHPARCWRPTAAP